MSSFTLIEKQMFVLWKRVWT